VVSLILVRFVCDVQCKDDVCIYVRSKKQLAFA
jgi:hypothetical protein